MGLQAGSTDSLIDVLDRILDKCIVIELWQWNRLSGITCTIDPETIANFVVTGAEMYDGCGMEGHKKELLGHLFPYWRKDFWTK